jgi:hypothetical protein
MRTHRRQLARSGNPYGAAVHELATMKDAWEDSFAWDDRFAAEGAGHFRQQPTSAVHRQVRSLERIVGLHSTFKIFLRSNEDVVPAFRILWRDERRRDASLQVVRSETPSVTDESFEKFAVIGRIPHPVSAADPSIDRPAHTNLLHQPPPQRSNVSSMLAARTRSWPTRSALRHRFF